LQIGTPSTTKKGNPGYSIWLLNVYEHIAWKTYFKMLKKSAKHISRCLEDILCSYTTFKGKIISMLCVTKQFSMLQYDNSRVFFVIFMQATKKSFFQNFCVWT
jgi:hypothetical protein